MLNPVSVYKQNTAFTNQPEENINDVGLLIAIYIKKIKIHLKNLQRTLKMVFHQKLIKVHLVLFTEGKNPNKNKRMKILAGGRVGLRD